MKSDREIKRETGVSAGDRRNRFKKFNADGKPGRVPTIANKS
jgi:hypothetical protein